MDIFLKFDRGIMQWAAKVYAWRQTQPQTRPSKPAFAPAPVTESLYSVHISPAAQNMLASRFNLGILSFNTSVLPDNAIITGVILKVKQQAILGGGNPVADRRCHRSQSRRQTVVGFPVITRSHRKRARTDVLRRTSSRPVRDAPG